MLSPQAWLAQRRINKELDRHLPDFLLQIGTALKSGIAFSQVLHQLKFKQQGILAQQMARVNQELAAGGNQEEALDAMAKRLNNKDLDLAVLAINVHSRSGGNLAENLTTIAERIRERVRLRDEIKTMTTQTRYSGYFLTAIPIAMGVLLFFVSPTYFRPLLQNALGLVLGLLAILLLAIGNFLMYRIGEVDV